MAGRAPSGGSYSFGPGPVTPAVRGIIVANVAAFLLTFLSPNVLLSTFGLVPEAVLKHGRVWQLATYLFLHSPTSITHILFNMLAVWMFGVDLERRWGARGFLTYYFVTGVGAGVCTVLVTCLPFAGAQASYHAVTIGASGAVYGLLLAWALLFPGRQVLFMLLFPLPARVYAILMGALALFAALAATDNGVANVAHLSGLLIGWLYLKGPRDLRLDLQYRVTRWRMDRLRRRFEVHEGGRGDWERNIH
jgi:membrane associated rhomboid family serine protease